MTPDIERAHRHSIRHRKEVLASETCGCFYCCRTFSPAAIVEWTDKWEGEGQTAICPHCRIDSVIGSESGYPVTEPFLKAMHERWFNTFGG
jgi:hypothetical protein